MLRFPRLHDESKLCRRCSSHCFSRPRSISTQDDLLADEINQINGDVAINASKSGKLKQCFSSFFHISMISCNSFVGVPASEARRCGSQRASPRLLFRPCNLVPSAIVIDGEVALAEIRPRLELHKIGARRAPKTVS